VIVVTTCFWVERAWIPQLRGVRLVRTPMGEPAASSLERTIGQEVPDLLLATGFCGALDPRLEAGDLVLAEGIEDREGRVPIDRRLADRAASSLAARGILATRATLLAAPGVVGSREEKARLREGGAAAVDMESGPLARFAARRGIPFLALRAVLDSAGEDLPFAAGGDLVRSTAAHPLRALRAARSALIAGRALGRAVPAALAAVEGGLA